MDTETVKGLRYVLPILIFSVLVHGYIISEFKQLPGPMYGGDVYWHYGRSLNIYNGAYPWENPQVSGEYEYFGWLHHLIIATIAKVFGIDLLTSYNYLPVIMAIPSVITWYVFGLLLFRDYRFALLMSLMFLEPKGISGLASDVLTPLALLFVFLAMRTKKIKDRIVAGIFCGLSGISYVSAFPSLVVVMAVLFAYMSVIKHLKVNLNASDMRISLLRDEDKEIVRDVKENFAILFPIGLIGLAISMLLFGPVLFVYKAHIPNPVNEYTLPDFSKYGTDVAIALIEGSFLDVPALMNGDIFKFVISIMTLIGLYVVIKNRKNDVECFIFVLVLSAFVGGLHYFVTEPVIGSTVIPTYLFAQIMRTSTPLLFVSAVAFLMGKKPQFGSIIVALSVIFMLLVLMISLNARYYGRWETMARSEANPAITEIAEWIDGNTDKNAVFISHEELSFLVNGLTARKVVTSRRTHFSPYLDINKRIADAVVVLYGDNEYKIEELIRQYNISYLYWDVNWPYFAKNEPPMTVPEYEHQLTENGVKFQKVNAYLNPAYSPENPKYDMLAVFPAKDDLTQPWSDAFSKHITPAKTFTINGKVFAIIFKVA